MLVNRSAADITAARECYLCLFIFAEQSSQQIVRSSDLFDIFIVYNQVIDIACIDLNGMPVNPVNMHTNLFHCLHQHICISDIR